MFYTLSAGELPGEIPVLTVSWLVGENPGEFPPSAHAGRLFQSFNSGFCSCFEKKIDGLSDKLVLASLVFVQGGYDGGRQS